jgi:hypothetical protein
VYSSAEEECGGYPLKKIVPSLLWRKSSESVSLVFRYLHSSRRERMHITIRDVKIHHYFMDSKLYAKINPLFPAKLSPLRGRHGIPELSANSGWLKVCNESCNSFLDRGLFLCQRQHQTLPGIQASANWRNNLPGAFTTTLYGEYYERARPGKKGAY